MASKIERVTLTYHKGSSNKIYHAQIVPEGNGYRVYVIFGRAGTLLKTACKTPRPVPLLNAKAIYAKVVQQKLAKGYIPENTIAPGTSSKTKPARTKKPSRPKRPASWSHPTLGRFGFDIDRWKSTVNIPAFKAFSYDTGYSNARRSTGKHTLDFPADDEQDLPKKSATKIADKVVTNAEKLVQAITKALWDDFTGRGPKTGMWWHGNLRDVARAMEHATPLAGPKDLLPLLQVGGITIHPQTDDIERPVAEIHFHARFEEEHGVAVLTDGARILGIGHTSDVTPFPTRRR